MIKYIHDYRQNMIPNHQERHFAVATWERDYTIYNKTGHFAKWLWIFFFPTSFLCPIPGFISVTLFWRRVFADMVKNFEMKWLPWLFGWALDSVTSFFMIKTGRFDTETGKRRRQCNQSSREQSDETKGCLEPVEVRRSKERFPLEPSESLWSC